MEETKNKKVSFKEYNYAQGDLFPANLENHPVRIVNKIINSNNRNI